MRLNAHLVHLKMISAHLMHFTMISFLLDVKKTTLSQLINLNIRFHFIDVMSSSHLVDLKVMSKGKFQTSLASRSWLFLVTWTGRKSGFYP